MTIATTALVILAVTTTLLNADQIQSSFVGVIDSSTFQAVHLDTNETYFGKIIEANDQVVVLTNVFYFLDNSKTKLVKRGEEAHSSSDSFSINRRHVLATENLDPNSPVATAIQKYLKNKN